MAHRPDPRLQHDPALELSCDPVLGWFTLEDHRAHPAPPFPDIQPGDILLTLSTHSLGWRHGHAGLVVEQGHELAVLESVRLGLDSQIMPLERWYRYSNCALLRVRGADQQTRAAAASYGLEHLLGQPYHLTAGLLGGKAPPPGSAGFGLHCTYLVWYAWYQKGWDLDSDGGRLVTASDLLLSEQLEVVRSWGLNTRLFSP